MYIYFRYCASFQILVVHLTKARSSLLYRGTLFENHCSSPSQFLNIFLVTFCITILIGLNINLINAAYRLKILMQEILGKKREILKVIKRIK